jgi:methionyl-tRNA formyltransferase
MINNKIKIGFFGTPQYSVITLDALKQAGFDIAFIVTQPDRPKGRNMVITPPPVKVWGLENNIPVLQPEKLRDEELYTILKEFNCDVFVVIAYGKIIPNEILNIPKHKSLNIHGSILPKYRGSCPIETAILSDDRESGVSIIRMDEEMDHGPLIATEKVIVTPWPPKANVLGTAIVNAGSKLIVDVIPKWINGEIQEVEQDHTKMISKEDGLIDLNGDPYKNYLKIQAYHTWPNTFFFVNGKRIKITEASFVDNKLVIEKVIPEGKSEIRYSDLTH